MMTSVKKSLFVIGHWVYVLGQRLYTFKYTSWIVGAREESVETCTVYAVVFRLRGCLLGLLLRFDTTLRILRGSEFASNSKWNRTVCKNTVTGVWGSCTLVMGSCQSLISPCHDHSYLSFSNDFLVDTPVLVGYLLWLELCLLTVVLIRSSSLWQALNVGEATSVLSWLTTYESKISSRYKIINY